MKTNIFSSKEVQNYLCIGLLSLFMVSCGSYQNSSYYERDGIYGASNNRNVERNTSSDNYYKDYFSSLQNDNQTPETFTDIDSYSDNNPTNNNSAYSNYGDWGNNYTKADVNVYSNYWGLNYGFGYSGWGYPYSFSFGWNSPYYYGYGWNNWGYNYYPYSYGWNYPYYGYNNYYYYNRPNNNNYRSYAPGRRGSTVTNSTSTNRDYAPTRSYSTSRNYSSDRSYSTNGVSTNRNNTFTNPKTYNNSNSNNNTQTITRRGTTQSQNNDYNSNRQQSNYSRSESYTPTRSYSSPSYGSESSGRSYGGGGGSSSGGSSSRSSGGSRR
ncbi:MAG: hypothetical protein RLZZ540_845 [Bacteroidota bacterium]|jgi:hypothetical protein